MNTTNELSITGCVLVCCLPSILGPGDVRGQGTAQTQPVRYVDGGDKTVTDTVTGLMWAARDNGADITWDEAKRFCENYRGGGYSDWRMPAVEELRTMYDTGCSQVAECYESHELRIHVTPLIRLTCYAVWASQIEGSRRARYFGFYAGHVYWHDRSLSEYFRAMPVRSLKHD